MALVPDEVVDRLTITGDVERCAQRILEYAGVSDGLILARTGQRSDNNTIADYDDLFDLINRVTK